MPPLFEFQDVSAEAGTSSVLRGINAVIPDQRLTVIAGASGSGKTSLLRLCNRLDIPSGGRINYRDKNLLDFDPRQLRRRVGMVFQRPAIFPGTVRDNLLAADQEATEAAMREALQSVDIQADFLDRIGDSLSGGEAQRVCLARALLCGPEVLLMDEPTASLHPAAATKLETTTQRLKRDKGVGVIWVTHDLHQIGRLAEHLLVLHRGLVRYSGDPVAPAAIEALQSLAGEEEA